MSRSNNKRKTFLDVCIIILMALGIVVLFLYITSRPSEKQPNIFSYTVCTDDATIRYYDREHDLVFMDVGIRGCETIELVYVEPQEMYYGSGDWDTMSFENDGYEGREFNRNDYDSYRFSIRK